MTALWLGLTLFSALALSGVFTPLSALTRLIFWAMLVAFTVFIATGWVVSLSAQRHESHLAQQAAAEILTLDDLQAMEPGEFEAWVQKLFRSRGYHVDNTPDSRDHGIDLRVVSPQGEPGIVQCKRYHGVVGEPVVRDLYGVIEHEDATRGYLVTTGIISTAAHRWVQDKPIELIDGPRLALLAGGQVDPSEPLVSSGAIVDG